MAPRQMQVRPLEFRPSARLQRYLGQELIADPNLAVLEFVKNAYDAGATHVLVNFNLDREPSRLIVSDNGAGMTESEFRANWMRPGFSSKAPDAPRQPDVEPDRGPRSAARRLERTRIPSGEKGLGRMAAGRLGERLDVYTRPTSDVPWLHVPFVWSDFDDMTRAMDDVKIQPEYVDEAAGPGHQSGTILVVSGLRQRWDGKLRGRPAAGRSRTRLGRLRQDLEFFVRPLQPDFGDFEIDLLSDLVADPADNGRIERRLSAESGGYEYQFAFSRDTDGARVTRTILRSPDLAAERGLLECEELGTVPVQLRDTEGAVSRAPLACGEFSGVFYYVPPPAAARAATILPMGVLLFRDGFWVEPYGIGSDDWLGVAALKAARQGHAAVQPNSFTGHVAISRAQNPRLEDMSNRMGLLENDESEEFLQLVREEFRYFEQLVYREVLEPRWEGNKVREAGERAADEAEVAAIFLRSLAHSVRQPLEGIQVELSIVDEVSQSADLPEAFRTILAGVSRRARAHAAVAGRLIQDALRFEVPEFVEVALADLLAAVQEQCAPEAESRGVDMKFLDAPMEAHVLVPRALVVQALSGLVANAIQAERAPGRGRSVVVSAGKLGSGDWAVRVLDDGGGISNFQPGQALASLTSTRARPGGGLRLAELAATASHGRVEVERTGPEGTSVRLLLPIRVSGLRD